VVVNIKSIIELLSLEIDLVIALDLLLRIRSNLSIIAVEYTSILEMITNILVIITKQSIY
jgi:hypothetical protein